MAIRVMFASQKGGVGKSTLARSLAVALAGQGKEVLIADFDTEQLTCLEWQAQRVAAEIEPDIEVASFKNLTKLDKIEHRYDVVVLDTRGFADKSTKEIARYCDVIFLPSGPSLDDLRPTVGLANHLFKKKITSDRIAVVLSRVGRSARQEEDARDFLRLNAVQCLDPVWPNKDGYVPVFNAGRVGREAPHPTLRTAAEAVDKAMMSFVRRHTAPRLRPDGK